MNARPKRRNTKRILGKLWAPAVILAVLAIAGYGVNTVRGMNEDITHPPVTSAIPATVVQINPKNVTYEVFGTSAVAGKSPTRISTAAPIEVTLASLPWSHFGDDDGVLGLVEPRRAGRRRFGGVSDPGNGQVRDEHSVSHPSAAVACTVTAA